MTRLFENLEFSSVRIAGGGGLAICILFRYAFTQYMYFEFVFALEKKQEKNMIPYKRSNIQKYKQFLLVPTLSLILA